MDPEPRPNQFVVIKGTKLARLTTAVLIEQSAWFEFMPFPDDEYRITFKPEQGHYIRGFVKGASEMLADLAR